MEKYTSCLCNIGKNAKANKNTQRQTKTLKNAQKQTKTLKNAQKQTKANKNTQKTKSYQSAKPLITNETLFSIEQSVQAS